jgi:LacI family transcriptional regulator
LATRLKDIARDLGISPMAVSKALRNHADIGQETKERVLRRAAELNYEVDWVARSLKAGQTYLVGLVIPDLMQSFFSEIATAVAARLAPAGYHLVISHTKEDAKEEAANIRLLSSRKVDGLIIASAQRDGRGLEKLDVPYVLIDRALNGARASFVGNRNEDIGFLATAHLAEQGCRRIAHLKGPPLSSSEGRLRGYEKALRQGGLALSKSLILSGGHDDRWGYEGMQQLLKLRNRPDGVFCFNDPVAVGAMRAILEAGCSVPGEIALIGVANMHYADLLTVPLSTIDQGTAEIGTCAAEQLLSCLASKRRTVREYLITPRLIVRSSSRRQT